MTSFCFGREAAGEDSGTGKKRHCDGDCFRQKSDDIPALPEPSLLLPWSYSAAFANREDGSKSVLRRTAGGRAGAVGGSAKRPPGTDDAAIWTSAGPGGEKMVQIVYNDLPVCISMDKISVRRGSALQPD